MASRDNNTTSSKPVAIGRSRVPVSNVSLTRITDRFKGAASRLVAGTLVKDEQFTLFESVGALEIGDPKMDSGCLDEDESHEDDYDTSVSPSVEELLWLMDKLLCHEVAWHMGYPLSQTLFTSIHIESLLWPEPVQLSDAHFGRSDAKTVQEPLLHRFFLAYCLGLIKCCDLVLIMVTGQHYYEEEDFATQLFNRNLLRKHSVDHILKVMRDGLEWLSTAAHPETVKEALHMRMEFRIQVLEMLVGHAMSSEKHDTLSLQSLLDSIQSTAGRGKAMPDAFSLKIQRRLASTVPPRPIIAVEEAEAFTFWRQSLQHLSHVFSVLETNHPADLLLSFSIFNAQRPQPAVYVRALMQSFLDMDGKVGPWTSTLSFILEDARFLTFPHSNIFPVTLDQTDLLSGIEERINNSLKGFIFKIEQSYLNIFRTMCLNRCRTRRTMCHAALEWDQIQMDAEDLDDDLHQLTNEEAHALPGGGLPTYCYALSSWVCHHKLSQMELIVQMGFELSVYAPYEIPGMYWYLSSICNTHLVHLERISFFMTRQHNRPTTTGVSLENSEKSNHDSKKALQLLYRHFSWLKATEALAKSLHALYVVLQRHGNFQRPSVAYASDELRYEIRMRPFLFLSMPEPISHATFDEVTASDSQDDKTLLTVAASAALTAKKGWEEVLRHKWHTFPRSRNHKGGLSKRDVDESDADIIGDLWRDQVRGMLKAAIATSIMTARVQKLLGESQSRTEQIVLKTRIPTASDKEYWHPWWLVPQLVS